METQFYANGKLLITGEYVVLDGALSLALPCKFGQSLQAAFTTTEKIVWKSYDVQQHVWFTATFDAQLAIIESSDEKKATVLQTLLTYCFAHTNAPLLASIKKGLEVTTSLKFPNDWGLGSSSTLLVNLAHFFEINPYDLHFATTNGSGYDIACGMLNTALLYQLPDFKHPKPIVTPLPNNPFDQFKTDLFFVHLNQKQKSDKEVASYQELKKHIDIKKVCTEITKLTERLITVSSLSGLNELLETHEALLSNVLQRDTVQETTFQMYKGGAIKSLGAWGGDFVLVCGAEKDKDYFREKGYTTLLSFDEMIR